MITLQARRSSRKELTCQINGSRKIVLIDIKATCRFAENLSLLWPAVFLACRDYSYIVANLFSPFDLQHSSSHDDHHEMGIKNTGRIKKLSLDLHRCAESPKHCWSLRYISHGDNWGLSDLMMYRWISILLCMLMVAGPTLGWGEEESPDLLLERALKAPPSELAAGYLAVEAYLLAVKLARVGVTSETPKGEINASNAEMYSSRYSKRLAIYAAAIRKRGFRNIAGIYSARASESCKEVPAMLAALGEDGTANTITITQDQFKADLKQNITSKDKSTIIDQNGIVVETTLVVADAITPD
ncbi:MAG: hypothetical protein WAW96_02070, partial [Alphaproteobacteria bacterium]